MGVINTKLGSTDVNYADAFVYRNRVVGSGYYLDQGYTLGVVGDNIDILNDRYDKNDIPSGLGSGVFVNNDGRYLYSDEYGVAGEPVTQFTVVNLAGDTIYAGYNINSVSGWSLDKGMIIESGQSFTFGEVGSEKVRNVWAVCDTSKTALVGGYATNQMHWI